MYSQKIEIKNPTGLHARPAAEFCKKASTFKADIHIKRLTPPESIMNRKDGRSAACAVKGLSRHILAWRLRYSTFPLTAWLLGVLWLRRRNKGA